MLNAKQILEENLLKLKLTKGKPSQIGYDLSLMEVNKVGGSIGKILKDKTVLNTHSKIDKTQLEGVTGWLLYPGVYDFVMWEGCKIPNNRTAFIKQRSSLMRNGALMQSSVFDPGFETDHIGSYGFVVETIFIEENARVAQIYFHESTPTNELYNGQYQFDIQRSNQ